MSRRLLASYLTLAAVVLLALEVPLAIFYGRSERRDLTARVERDAVAMASLTEDILELGQNIRPEGLRETSVTYARDTGGRIVVVNRAGASLLDSDAPDAAPRSFASRPEIAEALAGKVATGTRFSSTLDTDLLYVAVPVASGGEVLGAVRITYPTSALDARIRRYWLMLGAIAGVVLGASALVGVRFARTITRPLSRVEQAAGAAGHGDLTVRAPVDGPPEVRSLAVSFNDMVVRLDELVRSQQEFVADASHQLRTPLAALQLRLENLAHDVATPEGQAGLERALAEVDRLSRLVTGLLALARADAAGPPGGAVDLAAVSEERVLVWSAIAEERGVTLTGPAGAEVFADATPERLEQALDNLIENALDHSPDGGNVQVSVASHDETAEIHVVDQGPGMTAEERKHAFDRFWQARPRPGGSGLGLAIVRRLVEADGGSVEIDEAPGGGLDVVIRLRGARSAARAQTPQGA